MDKNERILFSKQILQLDLEINNLLQSLPILLQQKQEAIIADNTHKNLLNPINQLISAYHNELGRYNGFFRTNLTEGIIQDAANLKIGNLLYPNDFNNPPPSLASIKVWPHMVPFIYNVLIGAEYNENYPPQSNEYELQKLNYILNLINTIESSYHIMTRVTGQKCVIINSNHIIQDDANIHNDLTALINAINNLINYLTQTSSIIPVNDSDNIRAQKAIQAVNHINTALSHFNTWLSYPNFNNNHGQSDCNDFYNYDSSLLGDTKLQAQPLTNLKNVIIDRINYLNNTRINEILSYLGNLTQDLSNGQITSGSGLYFVRYQYLLLRLGRIDGSLFKIKNIEQAINAQNNLILNAQNKKSIYTNLLHVSPIVAPTNGTNAIVIKSAEGFSVNDSVYIASDTQDEIFAKIIAIEPNNRLRLSINVPPVYLPNDFARLYKLL